MKRIQMIFKAAWHKRSKSDLAPCDTEMIAVTDAVDHPEATPAAESALRDKITRHRHISALLQTCYDPVLVEPVPDHLHQLVMPAAPAPVPAASHQRNNLLVMPRHWAYAASVLICGFSVMAGFGAAQLLPSEEPTSPPNMVESDSALEDSPVQQAAAQETPPHAPVTPYGQAMQATAQPFLYEAEPGIAPAVDGTSAGHHGNSMGMIAPFAPPVSGYEAIQPPAIQPAAHHDGEEESL